MCSVGCLSPDLCPKFQGLRITTASSIDEHLEKVLSARNSPMYEKRKNSKRNLVTACKCELFCKHSYVAWTTTATSFNFCQVLIITQYNLVFQNSCPRKNKMNSPYSLVGGMTHADDNWYIEKDTQSASNMSTNLGDVLQTMQASMILASALLSH